jgi:hypothetical protein
VRGGETDGECHVQVRMRQESCRRKGLRPWSRSGKAEAGEARNNPALRGGQRPGIRLRNTGLFLCRAKCRGITRVSKLGVVFISDEMAKDGLGRVSLAGGSLTVSTRPWTEHDGREHRTMTAGAPDPLELQTVLRFLARLGLVAEQEECFDLTPLGSAVVRGEADWPSPEGDAVASSSDLGIAAQLRKGGIA